ncbi:SCAN domain-containing protein 3-like [Dermacentor variabilis]|uniref:SCAN domain-containing protein 3-like n=1 Tax=Dermacentor variabilis TaxID=34621 RepID=UPI003F5BF653
MGFTKSSPPTTTPELELKLACYSACHATINSVDHLGELLQSSTACEVKLHRTKCAALITKVLARCLLEDLVKDIGASQYSLLIDESTDVANEKQVAVVVRYFSTSLKKVVSTFLGLFTLEGSSAQQIAQGLLDFLTSVGLDFIRCIGIGTDGCNVMVGRNNSVYTHLRRKNENLMLVKCVCHSIQLCASKAVEVLPRSLEFLVGRSYSWFSHSSLRLQEYGKIYRLMNNGKEPLKLVQLSGTRWLSISGCCKRILEQWEELKLHFTICKDKYRCYDAENLSEMYRDPVNKLYLVFLNPLLQEFSRINKLFQLETGNPLKLVDCLQNLFRSLICRVLNPLYIPAAGERLLEVNLEDSATHLPLSAVDFGVLFNIEVAASKLNAEQEKDVKLRCRDFIFEAAKQVQLRLPPNIQLWHSMKSFSPENVLSQVKLPLQDVPLLKLFKGDVGLLDTQYRRLCLLPWKNVNKDGASFWVEVLDFKDASGESCFKEIAEFALSLLAMPLSNADVERVFSHMNLVKSRHRNRMKNPMLSGILHVRYGLKFRGVCCRDFQPTLNMLQLFNSKNMYGSEVDADDFPDESNTSDDDCV